MLEVFPPGTRVEKTNSVPGKDTHQDGAKATIVQRCGPVRNPETGEMVLGYFVHWDDIPNVPVFVACTRLKRSE